jgi:Histone methylation protein DOT1
LPPGDRVRKGFPHARPRRLMRVGGGDTGVERLIDWAGRVVDRCHGLDTADTATWRELGEERPEQYTAYEPSRWLTLRLAFDRRTLRPEDVFADLGSGKGRVVLQAARIYPWKRVIGVEISGELNRVARANLEGHRQRLRCLDVELVTADITTWTPPDDRLHVQPCKRSGVRGGDRPPARDRRSSATAAGAHLRKPARAPTPDRDRTSGRARSAALTPDAARGSGARDGQTLRAEGALGCERFARARSWRALGLALGSLPP